MSNTIWFNDPIILIHKDNIYQIIPDSMMNNSEKINALSRLIILLTIVLFLNLYHQIHHDFIKICEYDGAMM